MYTDPVRRSAMSAVSRSRAENLFSLKRMIRNYEEFYTGLLDRQE